MIIASIHDFLLLFGYMVTLALPPIIIISIVKARRKRNREIRENQLSKNYCNIGCKNCNAMNCPNNPTYISKLNN